MQKPVKAAYNCDLKKKKINLYEVTSLQKILRHESLNTVCESAKCPNIGECFSQKTATILILGNRCTRRCGFCAIEKGIPEPIDYDEPERAAKLIKTLKLRYAVITSVTRDDLPDGGANHFFKTVNCIRRISRGTKIEILVPDFGGKTESAEIAFSSSPDVFSHNIDTVPRLYSTARNGADYQRSLKLLSDAKTWGLVVKSGLMLGLGEKENEVLKVISDIRKTGCDILTLGQYLAPTKKHFKVFEHISKDIFENYRKKALEAGFSNCISGSYVRSSYLAESMLS